MVIYGESAPKAPRTQDKSQSRTEIKIVDLADIVVSIHNHKWSMLDIKALP